MSETSSSEEIRISIAEEFEALGVDLTEAAENLGYEKCGESGWIDAGGGYYNDNMDGFWDQIRVEYLNDVKEAND